MGISIEYEWEYAGFASVGPTDSVTAGVCVSPLPVSSVLRVSEGGVRLPVSITQSMS